MISVKKEKRKFYLLFNAAVYTTRIYICSGIVPQLQVQLDCKILAEDDDPDPEPEDELNR